VRYDPEIVGPIRYQEDFFLGADSISMNFLPMRIQIILRYDHIDQRPEEDLVPIQEQNDGSPNLEHDFIRPNEGVPDLVCGICGGINLGHARECVHY
jgi:hypothetical protein